MAKSDVKLLGAWSSPFVMRPRIALSLKSVEYEYVEEQLGNKSELLLKSNPVHKKIPVLIHGDKPINESLIIVEYIDQVWSSSPSILPSDPYERATARFWAAYVDEKWFPSLKKVSLAEDEEAKKTAFGEVEEGFKLLEEAFQKISKGKTYFGGDQIGYLDIAFGSYIGWIRAIEKIAKINILEESKLPGLTKWAATFSVHDAVKPYLPEADKLVEFSKVLRARMKAAPTS